MKSPGKPAWPSLDGAAALYLLLSGVYLLYWNHVEYYVDDWVLLRYLRNSILDSGPSGALHAGLAAAQNRIYETFRLQWLSTLAGLFLTVAGNYSAKVNFAALLAVHTANAWLLYRVLSRAGLDRGVSFLAGALLLLLPTTHFVIFTYLINPYHLLAPLWILSILYSGLLGKPALIFALAVTGMFIGEQTVLLLLASIPLALSRFGRETPRRWIGQTGMVFGGMAIAGILYMTLVNRYPIDITSPNSRYNWSLEVLRNNLRSIYNTTVRLSGLTQDSFFQVFAAPPGLLPVLLAIGAAALVGVAVWRWTAAARVSTPVSRFWLCVPAGILLAHGPNLFLGGRYAFRYHYIPSPFLAAGIALGFYGVTRWLFARWQWDRPALALISAAAVAFCTLNAAADIEQCWIPQSDQHRMLQAALKTLTPRPGDTIVVTGVPLETGTAEHFTLSHPPGTVAGFAELVTGVRPLNVARDGSGSQDAHATHVLVYRNGKFTKLE